jgi:DNA-damage-inducible protein D
MDDLMRYSEQTFEDIKHINEYGQEYWYARELAKVLEYNDSGGFAHARKKH